MLAEFLLDRGQQVGGLDSAATAGDQVPGEHGKARFTRLGEGVSYDGRFVAFWGAWGASIPRIRTQAGVDDAQLGLALLFVGAGALPAMMLTGRAIDRWGLRVAGLMLTTLGGAGVLVALIATDLVSLSIALTVVGVTSGASDVATFASELAAAAGS